MYESHDVASEVIIDIPEIEVTWVPILSEADKKRTCLICLKQLPTVELKCEHYYHLQCIKEWYRKEHYSCPLCDKHLDPAVKIYCLNCFAVYFETSLVQDYNKLPIRCEKCR